MLEFFQFIFSSFWYFLGFVIIIGVIFKGIQRIILAIGGKEPLDEED